MAATRPARGGSDPRREVAQAILGGRLTRAHAARELAVSAKVIRRWVEAERRARFVAVEVRDDGSSPATVVEVVLAGGRVLRVATAIDGVALGRLVRALESC